MAGGTEASLLPQEGLLRGPRSKDRAQRQRGRLLRYPPGILPSQGLLGPTSQSRVVLPLVLKVIGAHNMVQLKVG